MNTLTYYNEQNIKNSAKMNEILSTLPYFVNEFFVSIESCTSSLTRLNYARDLIIFFNYLTKHKFKKEPVNITIDDIKEIKAVDIEMYLSQLSAYQSDGKIRINNEKAKLRKLSAIRNLMKFLFQRDYIPCDVSSKVKSPKIRDKEIVRLEVDEVSKMICQIEDAQNLSNMQQKFNKRTRDRDLALVSLMLGTGIRVSECVGIDTNDLDFDNNAFKITRKGGYSTILYFSDEIREFLIKWLETRSGWLKNQDEKALFISLQNKRINVRTVENLVKKYAHAVTPLKKITPHKLRSTYGTNLYRETKDIYIVADVLGHKDVNTTKKHYAAISEDLRRDVANKVKLR